MKDIKSYIIGFLSSACILLFMGQSDIENSYKSVVNHNKYGKYQGFSNDNTLNIPLMRRQVNEINMRWILRNLSVLNGEHVNFS